MIEARDRIKALADELRAAARRYGEENRHGSVAATGCRLKADGLDLAVKIINDVLSE
jgi:hypothetical protein